MKKNKKILKLIIMCVILLIILVFIYYKVDSAKKQTGKPLTPVVDPKDDDVLNLSGFGVFFEKYDGYFKSSEIAAKLEDITINVLPKLYNEVKEYDDENLKKYFDENTAIIEYNFGITNFEVFKNMIEKLKQRNIDLSTSYRLDLEKETFSNDSDKTGYAYVKYNVSYKNDEKINFSVYVSKDVSTEESYIINVEK